MSNSTERTNVPVAIIGMACRLPGADNLEQYWELLAGGKCVVGELPHERLDQSLYYDPCRGKRGKTYSKLGAIVSSRDFDRESCPMPKELERDVDLAHLLTCQVAAEACRQAGLDPFNLPLRNTGVYIGHAQGSDLSGEYIYGTCIEEAAQFLREVEGFQQLPPELQESIIRDVVETVRSETPNRAADSPDLAIHTVAGTISKAFGLTGPYMAVNSACASSLQTILMAVRALQLGRIDMAIVGGASDCKSDTLVLFSHAQSMSETGSRPFDASADGLICSEGYVALVLKTLPKALADGDPIQAVIVGLGASSDGRGKSLWAPRKEGQTKAMERAYRNGIDMASLQYIEAHATSTSLGDATELSALVEVFGQKFPQGKRIPVASVKANIGHALESAGIAGVIKTILCMQRRTIAPAINIQSLNSKIDWDTAPIYVPLQREDWPEQPDGTPRRAAVNAFGIGGLNLHVVLDEFTEARRSELTKSYAREAHQSVRSVGAASGTLVEHSDRDAIAIVGMGCIFPGALHVKEFWELLRSGRDPKGPTPPGRWRADLAYERGSLKPHRTPTTLGGYITDFAYDWKKHKVPPKQVEQADPLQFMLLEAVDQAFADAGYDKQPFDRSRVGVIVGTQFGSDFGTQLEIGLKIVPLEIMVREALTRRSVVGSEAAQIAAQYTDVLVKHWPAIIDETGSFSTSTLASRITKTMDLMGGAAALDSGYSSAAAALSACRDLLLSGDCDMMVCASGQRCMSLPQYEGMAMAGVLAASERPVSPFDAKAEGVVPAEGVGVVLLKRLSDAVRDGNRIHTIIRGIGAAHGRSADEAMRLAMERALQEASAAPDDVAAIELDGTGLPASDEEQIRAVLSVYGQSQRKEPLLLSTVVGQIGHSIGASAMASLIKASMEVEKGEMPGTVGLESPLAILPQNASVIRASTGLQPIRHMTSDGRRLAAVSSFGKGLAYHILLERGERVPVIDAGMKSPGLRKAEPRRLVATAAPVGEALAAADAILGSSGSNFRICRLGAATPDALDAKIKESLGNCAAVFAAAETAPFAPADRARLAIVADSVETLSRKLQSAAKQWRNPAAGPVLEQQGCFYRTAGVRHPRVAFLFPGQGSHYHGMLRELVRDVPAAAAAMRAMDAVMMQHGLQTFGQMAWENSNELGSDIWVTQVVMLLADLIVHAAIVDLGVRPDLIAGHSYGELAALTAGGSWDLETVITLARARYESIEATPGARGAMLATDAGPQLIEQLAALLPTRVYVANVNAPDQAVVGGCIEGLKELAGLLESRGHAAQILSVPCPYHTPLMEGAGARLKRTLDKLSIHPPRVPTLSTVTNRYVAEPDEIRSNLAAQLTTPVRYLELVQRIAEEQNTVFVEVGPQQALTRLNRRILDGREVAGIIACDNPKRAGLEQLLHVRALLECVGGLPAPSAAQPVHITAKPAATPGGIRLKKGDITHIDATERRRQKMRQVATKGSSTAGSENGAQSPVIMTQAHGSASLFGGTDSQPAARTSMPAGRPAPVSLPRARIAPRDASAAEPPPRSAPAPKSSAVLAATGVPERAENWSVASVASDADAREPHQSKEQNTVELEQFLINFVVEQTGYPPEVVELDADLEADLGIDSIKKAQMFGELREYFDVTPTDNLTLDDFPTLRHIVNFLAAAPQKAAPQKAAATSIAAPARNTPQPVAPLAVHAMSAPAPKSSAVLAATGVPERAENWSVASVASDADARAPHQSKEQNTVELEQFLINFVVEQTGYPPEVVELDADLEADLGIDSIKKAQMFGELREYFDVTPTDNLTLDDFPTLRHIVNFLAAAPQKAAPQKAAATSIAAPARNTPQPVAPLAVHAMSAPAPKSSAVLAATGVPERAENWSVASVASDADARAPHQSKEQNTVELEQFLINFVVEQTGYPPEVVELDADLEADLGIDSIKKAQMFGELREYFDVTPTDNLTLDDFPTLRHIVNFLAAAPQKAAPQTASVMPAPLPAEKKDSAAGTAMPSADRLAARANITVGAVAATEPRHLTNVDVLYLRGSPYELGYQQGNEKKVEIRRILRRLVDLTDGDWSELPIPPAALEQPERFFSADELEELRGLADAVEVPQSNLQALNLAVRGDLAGNCAQVGIAPNSRSATSVLHGFVGELSLPPALVEMISPFIAVREPTQGWACATVSFPGMAGSLVGVNGNGLAASLGALLNGPDRSSGTVPIGPSLRVEDVLHRDRTITQAKARLQATRLPQGWVGLLSHSGDRRMCVVEHNGSEVAEQERDDKLIATNHCLLRRNGSQAPARSMERLAWLQQRLSGPLVPTSAAELFGALCELPSQAAMRIVVVVDAVGGDLWLEHNSIQERIHVGALLPCHPAGDGEIALAGKTTIGDMQIPECESQDLHYDVNEEGQYLRFTLRMRPFPWETKPAEFPKWKGAAAIHGNGAMAEALQRRLIAGGATVVRLHESDSPAAAVAEFERASHDSTIAHLFLTSLRDEQRSECIDSADWNRLVERRLQVPYFLCQRFFQEAGDARRLDDCSVVALVDLGGDFGFSGNVATPESGFLTGLMKELYLEHSIVRGFTHVRCKAIDAPGGELPDALAANICRELAGGTNDYEVAFVEGRRYVQVALPAPAKLEPHSAVRPSGTWVVTGGARGITAECAFELGRRFGLKLHLIGRSRLASIDPSWRDLNENGLAKLRTQIMVEARQSGRNVSEAWTNTVKAIEIDRNLHRFVEAGVKCTYYACDVSDREALARVLDEVRGADGPIDGIVHGAGIEQACRFEKKTLQGLLLCLGAKVTGALNLMALTRQDPLRHFIGFGSTSGRLGGNGQADYAAASDMLCKLISWYRTERPDCHAVGFHWHPWDEVGMASRPETEAMLKSHNLTLMPKRAGVRHLLRELYTRPAETELLITNWEYHQRFYPKNVEEIASRHDLLGIPGKPVVALTATTSHADGSRVADRVVLRTIDAPLAAVDAVRPLPSAVLLLGDSADANAMASELTARGIAVHRLQTDDAEVACKTLEGVWRESPVRCLMLFTPRDPEAAQLDDRSTVSRRIERGVLLPYWVTQRWFQLVSAETDADPAMLVAVTSLGGDFGFTTPAHAPEGGALAGLLKSIYVEDDRNKHLRFYVKVMDFPPDEPAAQLVAAVCRELESGRPEVEVAWSRTQRRVVATVRQDVESLSEHVIRRGGTWVVTGGGRGITAVAALELARRYGLKLHVLGKSPAPDANAPWRNASEEQLKIMKSAILRQAIAEGRSPTHDWERVRKDREIQKTLDEFAAAGLAVRYHSCDVADWDGLAAVLDEIRAQDGPIEGIIHGAGFGKPLRFGTTAVEKLRRTVLPKVDGTLALMHLTRVDPLRHFIAFGSLSGRFGGNGLTDYAAANDMLAKLCGWFRRQRPDCLATCFHWQTWDQVGMALEAEALGITKNTFKMKLIPPNEGVAHLLAELAAGAPESEVLISDGYFERRFYPYDFEMPKALSEPRAGTEAAAEERESGTTGPLISHWHPGSRARSGVAQIVFDPVRDPFLIQHRLKGRPFLPGVVGIEALAEVASLALSGEPVHELQNIRITNGLAFPTDATVTAAVAVTAGDKTLSCALTSELRDRQGRVIDPARAHVEAFAPVVGGSKSIVADPPGRSPLGWFPNTYSDNAIIYHGPLLRCLTEVVFQYDGGWGKIVAPPTAELAGPRGDHGWLLPLAVLDACVVCCTYFLHLQFAGVIEVPYAFERLQWSRLPRDGETLIVRIFFRKHDERHSLFDFTLFTENDEPLLQATGYRTVRIGAAGV